MNLDIGHKSAKKFLETSIFVAVAGLGALTMPTPAFAQNNQGYTMAPPIAPSTMSPAYSPNADTVFQWSEVPEDEQVPIVRAVFDQGGYQLFDDVGETIVVPFVNGNLYVMRFAVSPNGGMYFVNYGAVPTLYVPRNGYLENATVAGAKWYPFTNDFHPSAPVYLGIAPSWDLFIGMGWYPNMVCWGGYWANEPFYAGGHFVPSGGFRVRIGSVYLLGWSAYRHHIVRYPAPYRIGLRHRDIYRWAHRPVGPTHDFRGVRPRVNRNNGGHESRPNRPSGGNRVRPNGGDNRIGPSGGGNRRTGPSGGGTRVRPNGGVNRVGPGDGGGYYHRESSGQKSGPNSRPGARRPTGPQGGGKPRVDSGGRREGTEDKRGWRGGGTGGPAGGDRRR